MDEKDDIVGQAQGLQFISKQKGQYIPNEIMENWRNTSEFDTNDHIFLLTGYVMDGLYALLITIALLIAFKPEIKMLYKRIFNRNDPPPNSKRNTNNRGMPMHHNKSNSFKEQSDVVRRLKWLFFGERREELSTESVTKSTQLKPKISFNNRFNKFFYEPYDDTNSNDVECLDEDSEMTNDGYRGSYDEGIVNMIDWNGVTVKKRRVYKIEED